MQTALKGVPAVERPVPGGILTLNGEYYYAEYPPAQEQNPAPAQPQAIANTN